MIKVNNLSKSYGSNVILKEINIKVNEGKIAVLYGKNGVGKTTLIKCIVGLININKGTISLNTNDKIGVVLNNEMLIKKLTIFEYLEFICVLKKLRKKDYHLKIHNLISYFDLENDKNKLIEELSNGTKSKVKLIASVVFDPLIMLLDEPFTGMDILTIEKSIELITKQAEKGASIIISTHNLDIVSNIKADILILKDNTITQRITHEEISLNKNHLKDFFIKKI